MIGSVPAGSEEVLTDALALVKVAVPRAVEPLVNVTVPVVPVGSAAVKVTD